MKITILAVGSEGDVRYLLALGKGLKTAGYNVCLAAHSAFEKTVCNLQLEFAPIRANVREAFESEAGQEALAKGRLRDFLRMTHPFLVQAASDCWAACQGADAILYSALGWMFAPSIGEKLNVPNICAFPAPLDPTRSFPSLIITQRNLGGILNRLTYVLSDMIYWFPFRSMVNVWRAEQLNLPPLGMDYPQDYRQQYRRQPKPGLFAFSPHVVPKPRDWVEQAIVTGYWFLDKPTHWQPPSELVDFLGAGPPPVYIGFGSMSSRKPEATTNIVLQALARSKQRGVLATGWGGLSQSDLPDDVFKIEWAPHTWLFSQMAAVVHHGGAGTTGAALWAGIPSVVVPHFADQPFWGYRVAALGAGPEPIPRSQLSVERLASAITAAVSDKSMHRRAAELGERIKAEDGVAKAVEAIDYYLLSS